MINLVFHKPQPQVYATLFICLVLSLVCLIVGLRIRKVNPRGKTPKWLVPFIWIVKTINNMAKVNLGRRWKSYAPYLLTLTLFIFFSNIAGVFGITSPTSYLVLDIILALSAFFVVEITGLVSLGPKKFFRDLLGDNLFISPIMLPINLISEISLPISLALRIMGNVMSGGVMSNLIKGLAGIAPWMWPISIIGTIVINGIFDLFSGTIQTLVFLLLTTTYTGMKINPKELEEAKEN